MRDFKSRVSRLLHHPSILLKGFCCPLSYRDVADFNCFHPKLRSYKAFRPNIGQLAINYGAPDRTWTCDPSFTSRLLLPAELLEHNRRNYFLLFFSSLKLFKYCIAQTNARQFHWSLNIANSLYFYSRLFIKLHLTTASFVSKKFSNDSNIKLLGTVS